MRASYGIATEIVDYGDGAPDVRCDSGAGGWDWSQHHTLDINHPATKGWLLHMLREATGDPLVTIQPFCAASVWVWMAVRGDGEPVIEYRDEWHADEGDEHAAALLAVWGKA
jgi:hypothetical protein